MAEHTDKQVFVQCPKCLRSLWIDWNVWIFLDLAWKFEKVTLTCECGDFFRLTKNWREKQTSVD